jgi:hypothetical protein
MKPKGYFIASLVILAVIVITYSYLYVNRDETTNIYCSPASRLASTCLDRQNPVCGWFDPEKVKCFAYPCAADFPNECVACMDDKVVFYTEGPCPEVGSQPSQ